MRLIDFLEKRRKDKQKRYEQLLEKEYEFRKEKLEARQEQVSKLEPCKTINPISFEGISSDTEPFGWPPGTVRGIITFWVVMTFCLVCLWNFMMNLDLIPMEWFLSIVAIVIGSYFYSRFKMGMV